MPIEIKIAALGAALLLVHILIATHLKTNQYGVKWNIGARDEGVPPPTPLTGRMVRAQANFQETLPIAIIALLGIVIAGRTSSTTALGGWIWLAARVAYIPLYAAGILAVRTLIWTISIIGIAMVIWPLLSG